MSWKSKAKHFDMGLVEHLLPLSFMTLWSASRGTEGPVVAKVIEKWFELTGEGQDEDAGISEASGVDR